MNKPRKDRLGKGLGALLGEYVGKDEDNPKIEGDIQRIPLTSIVANPQQPRKEFSEEELADLVDSIRENGLLQPLVVRPSPHHEGRYEIVAGERRYRSMVRLEWEDAPVMVKDVDDETLLVLALVENLQREALSPLEEAEGYQALIDGFGLTQEEVASAVGKNRSTIANMLRLLRLPPSLRKLVNAGELTSGHARALLGVADPVRMAELGRAAANEGWSVREMEKRVNQQKPGGGRRPNASSAPRDPVVRALEQGLQEKLATRAQIRGGGKKGKGVIEIPFSGTEEFERLFALITGVEASEFLG